MADISVQRNFTIGHVVGWKKPSIGPQQPVNTLFKHQTFTYFFPFGSFGRVGPAPGDIFVIFWQYFYVQLRM
jgi:hypothetical protein